MIYVCQPYGGMDPAQMEGLLTNYYEYHFLYITGIHHVESRNIQGMSLMKLYFHPGTNMAQAMAETINYVNRARAFMPPGTVAPFVMRFDTGSVPVGYLVLSSETRSIAEIQDLALFRVRPMFASLPGVSAPPPFGGNQRTIVVTLDPERLRAYDMSADEVVGALGQSNAISPSGNVPIGDKYPDRAGELRGPQRPGIGKHSPARPGGSAVYLRDVGYVRDTMDVPAGYALVNGRRSVYILVTKRADASTLSVVRAVKAALPDMQAVLPPDIRVSYEFDQSPYVTRAIGGVALEGALGAALVGLMVLLVSARLAERLGRVAEYPAGPDDRRDRPVAVRANDQHDDPRRAGLGHRHPGRRGHGGDRKHPQPLGAGQAARSRGRARRQRPRRPFRGCWRWSASWPCSSPAFFMQGAARAMFVPLSLAVGFSMAASYVLSSTLVPVASVWMLRRAARGNDATRRAAGPPSRTGWSRAWRFPLARVTNGCCGAWFGFAWPW